MSIDKRLVCKATHYLVCLLLLSTASGSFGKQSREKSVTGKSATLGVIKLRFQLYGIAQTKVPSSIRLWGRWCGEAGVDVAIRSLELRLGKDRVKFPPEVYGNLLNVEPATVTFRQEDHKLFLYMSGGDGAEHYETRIEVARDIVQQRETVGGAFGYPRPPYERIRFRTDGTSSYSLKTTIPGGITKPSGAKVTLTREHSS